MFQSATYGQRWFVFDEKVAVNIALVKVLSVEGTKVKVDGVTVYQGDTQDDAKRIFASVMETMKLEPKP